MDVLWYHPPGRVRRSGNGESNGKNAYDAVLDHVRWDSMADTTAYEGGVGEGRLARLWPLESPGPPSVFAQMGERKGPKGTRDIARRWAAVLASAKTRGR